MVILPAPSSASFLKVKVQVWVYRTSLSGNFEVLLLLLRPERGHYWQPVTGGVDPGETLDQAALREAQEETGLPFTEAPESLNFSFRFRSPRFLNDCEEHVFAIAAPTSQQITGTGQVRLDMREHVNHQWVPIVHAAEHLKHPSNREGLLRLRERLAIAPGGSHATR